MEFAHPNGQTKQASEDDSQLVHANINKYDGMPRLIAKAARREIGGAYITLMTTLPRA